MQSIPAGAAKQNSLYEQVVDLYGPALARLARAYELDAEVRRDLLQDIHLQLWRSFAYFDQRCSLRTWVYRVAHNVAAKHVMRQRRIRDRLVNIENFDFLPGSDQTELAASQAEALGRLSALVQRLKPQECPETLVRRRRPMNDPRRVWQNQPKEPFRMSADEMRLRAQRFQTKARLKAATGITSGLLLCA